MLTSVALDLKLSDKVVSPGDVYKILAAKYLNPDSNSNGELA